MGRDINERGGRRERKNQANVRRKEGGQIYAYHPTVGDKADLASAAFTPAWAWDVVLDRCRQGHRITIGFREGTDNLYILIREGGASWDQANAVSVWHVELDRAVIGLAYYLQRKNSEWPDVLPSSTQPEFDW